MNAIAYQQDCGDADEDRGPYHQIAIKRDKVIERNALRKMVIYWMTLISLMITESYRDEAEWTYKS